MPVTFNGEQKLILCTLGTVSLDVQEVYSDWKEWVQSGQGIGFLPAFEAIGGQPLPGGLFAGRTYFLINDWKIKPQSANHRLIINGNIYADDGSLITVPVTGFSIEVTLNTSAQAQGITTSGSTLNSLEIAQATWTYSTRTLTSSDGLTLSQIEASNVLAKKQDISNLQTFITPYLKKINTLWIGGGYDPLIKIVAKAPVSSAEPGYVKTSDNITINQTHSVLNGVYTLESQV